MTHFPGNGALGRIGDSKLVEAVAQASAEELKALGFNCNLAPCADVAEEGPSFIGIRSFGTDPHKVRDLARSALAGYTSGGVAPTLKHFPGHGKAKDSHEGPVQVSGTLSDLEEGDLLVFRELVPEASLVMTAHVLCPQIDPEHLLLHLVS